MKFRKNILSFSISTALLGLVGCGVTTQDGGLGGSSAAPVSGVAIDGYIARAVVYVDTNENNKLDVWETRALTDSRGYFTYSPPYVDRKGDAIAAVRYCDLPETHKNYAYCLKIPAGYAVVMVRMTQGLDLTTLDPFTGTLSMMVSSNSSTIDKPLVGTPITGLLAEMTDTQKTNFYSNESSINESLAKLDFLDFDTADLISADDRLALLALALKIHKVADSVAGVLDKVWDQGSDGGFFGIKEGVPTDASVYVYQAMADEVSATQGITELLRNQLNMERAITNAWDSMKKVVNDYNNANSNDTYTIPDTPDIAPIAVNSLELAAVVDTVFTAPLSPTTNTYTVADDAKSRIRAIDIMASLIRGNKDSAAIANAKTLASDPDYLAYLKSPRVDATGLKTKFTTPAGNIGTLTAEDANYGTRKSFTEMFGDSTLTAGLTATGGEAVNTGGFAGNKLEMGDDGDSVGITFISKDENGETIPDATSGTIQIDALLLGGDFSQTKKDEAGNDILGEDGKPVKEPITLEGTWEQIDDYTMLMNIEVAGVIEPVIVKPTVTQDANGNDVAAYYFDLGGKQQIWIP